MKKDMETVEISRKLLMEMADLNHQYRAEWAASNASPRVDISAHSDRAADPRRLKLYAMINGLPVNQKAILLALVQIRGKGNKLIFVNSVLTSKGGSNPGVAAYLIEKPLHDLIPRNIAIIESKGLTFLE